MKNFKFFARANFWVGLIASSLLVACGSSRKISTSSPEFTIIQTAKSYRGTPYRYGGMTRSGMDCSALIYHSFGAAGVQVPRTTSDQSKLGKKISVQKVRPGDLVFFATGKKKKEVTHAGIVTDIKKREVKFIHASTSLGVTESFLGNSYWSKAYLFAKRLRTK